MELQIETVTITKTINSLKEKREKLEDSLDEIKRLCFIEMHEHWQGSDYDNGFEAKIKPFLENEVRSYIDSILLYETYLQNYLKGFKALHSFYESREIKLVGMS